MSSGRATTFGPLELSRAQIDSLLSFVGPDGELKAYVPVSAMGPGHTAGKSIMRNVARALELRGMISIRNDPNGRPGRRMVQRAYLTEAGLQALALYREL